MWQIQCDPQAQVTKISTPNDGEIIFDLQALQALTAVGVEQRLYDGTTQLSRLTVLQPLVTRAYYQQKLESARKYWTMTPDQVGKGGKLTDTHCGDWIKTEPAFVTLKIIREFIQEAIKQMTTVFIPRLRELAKRQQISEASTAGSVPPQEPKAPTTVFGQEHPQVR